MENQNQFLIKLESEGLVPKSFDELVKVAPSQKTIGALVRENDLLILHGVMSVVIYDVFHFYNESLSDIQINLLMQAFKDAAKKITLPDVFLFKQECLSGRYPKKFRLTPDIFVDWIKQYIYDRGEAFASVNTYIHKNVHSTNEVSPKTVEFLNEMAEKVKKVEQKTENKEHENDNFTTKTKELQKWISLEFDNKSIQEEDEFGMPKGVPYMKFEGRSETKTSYIKLRYESILAHIHGEYRLLCKCYPPCTCNNSLDYENCAAQCLRWFMDNNEMKDYVIGAIEKIINVTT